jgi:hypothetical protein
MPGLDPGIHALLSFMETKTWMAGTSPAMTERGVSHPGLADIRCVALMLLLLFLLLQFLFPCSMAAIEAAGRRAQKSMMAGIVTGNAAHQRALQATLGHGALGRQREHGGGEQDCNSVRGGGVHGAILFALPAITRPQLARPRGNTPTTTPAIRSIALLCAGTDKIS